MKTILTEYSYGEILTGNADNFNYEQSIFQVKKEYNEAINWVKKDLKDILPETEIKVETLEDEAAADLVLIIGKDFE